MTEQAFKVGSKVKVTTGPMFHAEAGEVKSIHNGVAHVLLEKASGPIAFHLEDLEMVAGESRAQKPAARATSESKAEKE